MQIDPLFLIALGTASVVLLIIGIVVARKRARVRTAQLREHFGAEYDAALAEHDNHRGRAERALEARRKRIEKLRITPLSAEQIARFGSEWNEAQQHFVDDPGAAVSEADLLVKSVMSARGYPMGDFDQRVADLSVEHAAVLNHYRAARAIALANAKGEASTEDLRQAMVHYRALFSDLLAVQEQYGRLSAAPA